MTTATIFPITLPACALVQTFIVSLFDECSSSWVPPCLLLLLFFFFNQQKMGSLGNSRESQPWTSRLLHDPVSASHFDFSDSYHGVLPKMPVWSGQSPAETGFLGTLAMAPYMTVLRKAGFTLWLKQSLVSRGSEISEHPRGGDSGSTVAGSNPACTLCLLHYLQ